MLIVCVFAMTNFFFFDSMMIFSVIATLCTTMRLDNQRLILCKINWLILTNVLHILVDYWYELLTAFNFFDSMMIFELFVHVDWIACMTLKLDNHKLILYKIDWLTITNVLHILVDYWFQLLILYNFLIQWWLYSYQYL